jgi:thiol:disulfide interchange protein DsbD
MHASFLWLAASAGALSLLTPCVFPMIPITVSYFTVHASDGRGAAVRAASVFALGIIAMFTALGLVLAVLVGATGAAAFAANPWVNLGLAALFVAFALDLVGVIRVGVPSGVLTAVDGQLRRVDARSTPARPGLAGPVLMGVAFTLTSFTCTAPFVGTVLVSAAAGHWQQPAIGMLAYATVFALPFFVLALVPQWVARLPRSGEWMVSVKVLMGLLEMAAALKFLSNADLVWHWGIVTRDVVLACWVMLAGAAVVYLVIRGAGRPAVWAAVAPALLGAWLATGLAGRPLGELEAFLPPAAVDLSWHLNDLPAVLADARRDGMPVFVDFTGYTCTNCRWMEANMFSRPDVRRALAQYKLARLFTDGDGPVYERQQAMQESTYHTVALPLYALLDPDGRTIATYGGLTRDPAVFLAFLRQGARRVASR